MVGPNGTHAGPPEKKSHKLRNVLLVIIMGIMAIVIISAVAGQGSSTQQNVTQSASPNLAASAPENTNTSPPPPVANPDGTYQGSCDYTLGTGFDNNYHVIGEIDLDNTGNVGVIVHTRITWPQEGADPITARKTVHLPTGAHKPVRFRIPVTSEQIDLLQSWQERHDFKDGCTYHASFSDTYGPVS
jgi:hypothetical protein